MRISDWSSDVCSSDLGARGANIALMVELLAAGLTGANWSKDAPPFNKGSASPGAGLLILAIKPAAGFPRRLDDWLDAAASAEGADLPGRATGQAMPPARLRAFGATGIAMVRGRAGQDKE